MTYNDGTNQRHDRIFIGYEFDANTPVTVTLTCDGNTPTTVIDLGGYPLELELVTGSVTALTGLINILTRLREELEEHQVQHATNEAHGWTTGPLFVPDTWTSGEER
jgi:hypothetical protein